MLNILLNTSDLKCLRKSDAAEIPGNERPGQIQGVYEAAKQRKDNVQETSGRCRYVHSEGCQDKYQEILNIREVGISDLKLDDDDDD